MKKIVWILLFIVMTATQGFSYANEFVDTFKVHFAGVSGGTIKVLGYSLTEGSENFSLTDVYAPSGWLDSFLNKPASFTISHNKNDPFEKATFLVRIGDDPQPNGKFMGYCNMLITESGNNGEVALFKERKCVGNITYSGYSISWSPDGRHRYYDIHFRPT
jgi:hypothetical protein